MVNGCRPQVLSHIVPFQPPQWCQPLEVIKLKSFHLQHKTTFGTWMETAGIVSYVPPLPTSPVVSPSGVINLKCFHRQLVWGTTVCCVAALLTYSFNSLCTSRFNLQKHLESKRMMQYLFCFNVFLLPSITNGWILSKSCTYCGDLLCDTLYHAGPLLSARCTEENVEAFG